MLKNIAVSLLALYTLNACTYAVKPVTAPAVDIYSSYDEKVQGTWVVVVDDEAENISREIKTSSYVCSAHTYPINVGDALNTSIKRTMRSIFENTIDRSTLPSSSELSRMDARGTVLINLDSFDPRVRCTMGMWSGHCTATTDMELGVTVRGKNGKLFATSVGDSATIDGDSGGACEGASNVLSESVSKSMRETLEKLAERLMNAAKIRNATVLVDRATGRSNTQQIGRSIEDVQHAGVANDYASRHCGSLKDNLKYLGMSNSNERYSVTCSNGNVLVLSCSNQGCNAL